MYVSFINISVMIKHERPLFSALNKTPEPTFRRATKPSLSPMIQPKKKIVICAIQTVADKEKPLVVQDRQRNYQPIQKVSNQNWMSITNGHQTSNQFGSRMFSQVNKSPLSTQLSFSSIIKQNQNALQLHTPVKIQTPSQRPVACFFNQAEQGLGLSKPQFDCKLVTSLQMGSSPDNHLQESLLLQSTTRI